MPPNSKFSLNMDAFVGEETFVVAPKYRSTDKNPKFGTIAIEYNTNCMNDQIEGFNLVEMIDLVVVHGVITDAHTLIELEEGQMEIDPYILVLENGNVSIGAIIEPDKSFGVVGIAKTIELLVEGKVIQDKHIDIDDIFVVYGYEVDIRPTISDDDVDDEKLDAAQKAIEMIAELKGAETEDE